LGLISTLLLGVGLSMDAFAVSVTNGLIVRRLRFRFAVKMALCFGIAQAVMPFLGYTLGRGFAEYIAAIDHFIAFGLLAFIGIKMILESIKQNSNDECCSDEPDIRTLLIMAIATSIDALAAGVSLALAAQTANSISIVPAVGIIGVVTMVLCLCGAYIGRLCGSRIKKGAGILGGIVLVVIGIKILIEHL
jgi:putative Mn2+ efflux pump MntP